MARIRVLHQVYMLHRGGVETWLAEVIRRAPSGQYDFHLAYEQPSDPEVIRSFQALGATIHQVPSPARPLDYLSSMARLHRQHGPFQILHSHVLHAGIQVRFAARLGIPVRLVHSHTTVEQRGEGGWLRAWVLWATNAWIHRYATGGLAGSERAAIGMFGADWHRPGRWQLLPYGLNLSPFAPAETDEEGRQALRASLGLAPTDRVVASIARFHEQKNHRFFVRIARVLADRQPAVKFLLVGWGPLEAAIRQQVREAGLGPQFVFAGPRADVGPLLRWVVDVLLFPSRFEGLGLISVQTQAAGRPVVQSTAVPEESIVCPPSVDRVDLQAAPETWAARVESRLMGTPTVSHEHAFATVAASDYNADRSADRLWVLYEDALRQLPGS